MNLGQMADILQAYSQDFFLFFFGLHRPVAQTTIIEQISSHTQVAVECQQSVDATTTGLSGDCLP
jgi:hypothetical protein